MTTMEVKVNSWRNNNTIERAYTIGDYEVQVNLDEVWLEGVKIKETDNSACLFVFDVSNERHLELAHHIYKIVCDLKKELEASALQRENSLNQNSKASGKGK